MLQNNEMTNNQYQSKPESNHLLQYDNFQKLLALQNTIYQATRVKPSLYKLVNLIISQTNFMTIQETLIQQYQ